MVLLDGIHRRVIVSLSRACDEEDSVMPTGCLLGVVMFVMATLAGCASPVDAPTKPDTEQCPVGQRAVIGWGGDAHCVLPHGDYTNVTRQCSPQAIQSYYDWWNYDNGGPGALSCAAAGEAVCQDDKIEYDLDMADAKREGLDCPFVR